MKLYWTGDVGYYDETSGEGITGSMVKKQLDALNGQDVEVDLMSRGGDFWQIAPIMGMIRSAKGKKTVNYAGLVGSAATALAMAFEDRVSYDLSVFFIHNAQGWVGGDHNAMEEGAAQFKELSDMMAVEYSKATGMSVEKIKELMDGESGNGTWITGKKIYELGFSTRHVSDTDSKVTNSSMMLVSAQAQFRAGVSMWAKGSKPEATGTEQMKEVEALIESGSFDKLAPVPTDAELSVKKYPIAKNGKVFRSSLRAISARAAKDDPELAKWATAMIAKIDAKGELRVNKEAVLAWLKDNPGCASEVAAVMGLNLVTQETTAAVQMKAKLAAEKIDDPLATIVQLRADLAAVENDRVTNIMDATFGPVKLATGKENTLRTYAAVKLAGVKAVDMAAKIEEFKKDTLALKLAGELMDANSEVNLLGFGETKVLNKTVSTFDGVPVVTV